MENHSLTADVARSGSSVCSVGTGHIESALKECKLYLRELLQLVALYGVVVDTASVAFENEMTLPKYRKPVWLVVHNCVECSFVFLYELIAYLFKCISQHYGCWYLFNRMPTSEVNKLIHCTQHTHPPTYPQSTHHIPSTLTRILVIIQRFF